MNKEFIPYEQALELKELGLLTYKKDNDFGLLYKGSDIPSILYQQAFRWFREKGYRFTLSSDYENGIYYFDVWKSNQFMFETDYIYNTYEEAELACLKKLIVIIKEVKEDKIGEYFAKNADIKIEMNKNERK